MENFVAMNPTALHFGKGVISDLGATTKIYGQKVLLVYGKGSVVKNGIYATVVDQLKGAGATVFEYSGIKSNPIIDDVDAAAKLGRDNNVDVIVAVGGGSVIDSAKFISLAIPIQNKAWDILEYKVKPRVAVPLIAVLTLAATGTEMNGFAVVQNNETKQKPGYYSPFIYPRHSFLDPAYTISVPADYTAFGIVDLIAHCLEGYFGKGEAPLSDLFAVAIMSEAMVCGPRLMKALDNYDLRARIMYAATNALNGLIMYGKPGGDWGTHGLGHTLSVLYDVPHGASLSIAFPAWMKLYSESDSEKVAVLGLSLFGTQTAEEAIAGFERFFRSLNSPVRLSDINIGKDKRQEFINNLSVNKVTGGNLKLTEVEYGRLFDLML
ncbi:MAG: iron-containing alcohol dehydrogenase [Bacteroidota bacterium]